MPPRATSTCFGSPSVPPQHHTIHNGLNFLTLRLSTVPRRTGARQAFPCRLKALASADVASADASSTMQNASQQHAVSTLPRQVSESFFIVAVGAISDAIVAVQVSQPPPQLLTTFIRRVLERYYGNIATTLQTETDIQVPCSVACSVSWRETIHQSLFLTLLPALRRAHAHGGHDPVAAGWPAEPALAPALRPPRLPHLWGAHALP